MNGSNKPVGTDQLNELWEKGVVKTKEALEREIGKKQAKMTVSQASLVISGWNNGEYSFEESYPFTQYDITVEPDGDSITEAQAKAWYTARLMGSNTAQKIVAKGTVPSVNIPIIIKAVRK